MTPLVEIVTTEIGDHVVTVDHDSIPDGVDVRGRAAWPDSRHDLPAYTDAVLESWIADLQGSDLPLGTLFVQRGAAGQVAIATHYGSKSERARWLRQIKGLDDE